MRPLTLLLLTLALPAYAGPLAEGFRGTPWGAPYDRLTPPAGQSGCRPFTGAVGSSWTCSATISDVSFSVTYLYGRAGLMVGTIKPAHAHVGCSTLRRVAEKAYGPGQARYEHVVTSHWTWSDGTASAAFDPKGSSCVLSASDSAVFGRHEAMESAALPDGQL